MTRPWLIESKLYAVLTRYPERLWSLGIYADTDCLPWRLLWRDVLSGESGVICKFQPYKMQEYVSLAVRTLKRLRASERKLNQPMLWPEEYLKTRQEDCMEESGGMTKQERLERANMPKTLTCPNCQQEFLRGYLSPRNRNFCKPECRTEWTVKNAKSATKFTDADANRIFLEKHGAAEKEYYTGFVYRARCTSLCGAAEIGGANRRNGDPLR